jgi:hypothetical protein
MAVLRRPSAVERIRQLTCRLGEEFDGLPLPEVTRTVQRAASEFDVAGAADAELDLAEIERRARKLLRAAYAEA